MLFMTFILLVLGTYMLFGLVTYSVCWLWDVGNIRTGGVGSFEDQRFHAGCIIGSWPFLLTEIYKQLLSA